MSKGDGLGILVEFSDYITSLSSGDASCFSVGFNVPMYAPDGALQAVSKTPVGIDYKVAHEWAADLSLGTKNNTEYSNGALRLTASYAEPIDERNNASSMSGGSYSPIGMVFKCKFGGRIVGLSFRVVTTGSYVFTLYNNSTNEVLATKSVNITASDWNSVTFDTPVDVEQNGEYRLIANTPSSRFYRISYAYDGTFWKCLKEIAGSGEYSETPAFGIVYQSSPTYALSGSAEYTDAGVSAVHGLIGSSISWSEDVPTGTTVSVSAKLDGEAYQSVTNGGALPIAQGSDLSQRTLFVKVEFSTADTSITPSVTNLRVEFSDLESTKSIVLNLSPGNVNSFQNAVGNITLSYDGTGELAGEGGPVEAFEETFTPTGLTPKPNQNDAEHLEISATVAGILTRIYYTDVAANGHLEITATASGTLTHVDDL